MTRFTMTREFWIKKSATKVADKNSTAVVYVETRDDGTTIVMGFSGKRAKFDFNYRYNTAAQAERKVKWFFDAVQQVEASRTRRTADRKAKVATPVTVAFEVGRTYRDRSAGDHNCIFELTVISRTAKQITLAECLGDKNVTRGVYVDERGVERCKPFGTYSMCTVISADREHV